MVCFKGVVGEGAFLLPDLVSSSSLLGRKVAVIMQWDCESAFVFHKESYKYQLL